MNEYTVQWSMQFSAETPVDAARQALAVQRNPESQAVVFDVYQDHEGKPVEVDLLVEGVINDWRKGFRLGQPDPWEYDADDETEGSDTCVLVDPDTRYFCTRPGKTHDHKLHVATGEHGIMAIWDSKHHESIHSVNEQNGATT